jgi:DNA replication protein DnaC
MQLFERLVGVDLLHIDDLGAEKRTEWVLEQLYSIINERWQEQRSVVVTTNLIDVDELRDQIGPRTVSRLHEMCDLIPIMGRDRRMQPFAA